MMWIGCPGMPTHALPLATIARFIIAQPMLRSNEFDGFSSSTMTLPLNCARDAGLVIPAYDHVLKCSQLFHVLDTRGANSVTESAR